MSLVLLLSRKRRIWTIKDFAYRARKAYRWFYLNLYDHSLLFWLQCLSSLHVVRKLPKPQRLKFFFQSFRTSNAVGAIRFMLPVTVRQNNEKEKSRGNVLFNSRLQCFKTIFLPIRVFKVVNTENRQIQLHVFLNDMIACTTRTSQNLFHPSWESLISNMQFTDTSLWPQNMDGMFFFQSFSSLIF